MRVPPLAKVPPAQTKSNAAISAAWLWVCLIVLAVLVAVFTQNYFGGQQYTDTELGKMHLDHAEAELQQTIDDLYAGRDPNGPTDFVAPPQSWPVEHPGTAALIAWAVVLVVGRLFVFMHQMETRR